VLTPRSLAPDLARLPIGLNLRAISLAEGLRAALPPDSPVRVARQIELMSGVMTRLG
jgi:hypothetical protein